MPGHRFLSGDDSGGVVLDRRRLLAAIGVPLLRLQRSEFAKRLWVDIQLILVVALTAALAVVLVIAVLHGEDVGA